MPHEILFREQYGKNGREIVYVKPPDSNTVVPLEATYPQGVSRSTVQGVLKVLQTIFLPQGYPDSVSEDYLTYQIWDTAQAFSSTILGVLTTRSVLHSVGVGDETATPLAAAITWVLKDGAGMLGRIAFAWWKGTKLDTDCKKWRLFADVLNDIAMLLELSLPYYSQYAIQVLSFSTVLKSIVGVAGGATRVALTQHQAIRDNTADVSAKDGSQETCVNLIASLLGIFFLTYIPEGKLIWYIVLLLTSVHLYSNYRAVTSLVFSTLNEGRLILALQNYITTDSVPPPVVLNKQESVFVGSGLTAYQLCGHHIRVGTSLRSTVENHSITADELKLVSNMHRSRRYLILPSIHRNCMSACLLKESHSESTDTLRAYFHAVFLGIATGILTDTLPRALTVQKKSLVSVCLTRIQNAINKVCRTTGNPMRSTIYRDGKRLPFEALFAVDDIVDDEFDSFVRQLQVSGWKVSGQHLSVDEWRSSWQHPSTSSVARRHVEKTD